MYKYFYFQVKSCTGAVMYQYFYVKVLSFTGKIMFRYSHVHFYVHVLTLKMQDFDWKKSILNYCFQEGLKECWKIQLDLELLEGLQVDDIVQLSSTGPILLKVQQILSFNYLLQDLFYLRYSRQYRSIIFSSEVPLQAFPGKHV